MDKEMEKERRPEGVGSFLKRERELRGLSIEEISEQTRIQRAHLLAIENEDFARLPAGPFATGFIEAYARQLGLSAQEVLSLLHDEDKAAFSPQDINVERAQQRLSVRDIPVGNAARPSFPWRAALAVLAVFGILLAFWLFPSLRASFESILAFRQPSTQEKSGNAPAASAHLADEKAPPRPGSTDEGVAHAVQGEGAGDADASDEGNRPLQDDRHPAGTKADTGGSGGERAAASNPSTPSASLAKTAIEKRPSIEINGQTFDVYTDRSHPKETTITLTAKSKTYLRVSTSPRGKAVFEGILEANEQKTLSAKSDLYLIFGNIGGVLLEYNGHSLPLDGREGERRGIAFRLSTTPP